MDWYPSTDSSRNQQLASPGDTNSERSHLDCGSWTQDQSPTQNLESREVSAKKRKASEIVGKGSSALKDQNTKSQIRSHSLAEKRYRTNLNDKIAELRQCLPSLRHPHSTPSKIQGSLTAVNHNKATVLTKAIEYIHHLEKRNAYLEGANSTLQKRTVHIAKELEVDEVDVDETKSGSPGNEHHESQKLFAASTTATDEPIGMIPVPEDMRRLRDAVPPQAHYADQYHPKANPENLASGRLSITGGRTIGKLVVGSLAGLMIMDNFVGSGKATPNDRGLFALPIDSTTTILRSLSVKIQIWLTSVPYGRILVPLAKGLLIFALLSMVMFLYLFNSKPNLGKLIVVPSEHMPRPSASPMDMRRNAWLTAIQTVWVPRHSILLEMIALTLETHAYLTRNILGWSSYSWVTNRNEEDEIARVRALDIAIDAQLAGGDVELSKSRLVLTLWASGTLPNTPVRLMLKALHIRILFWQTSRDSWVSKALDTVGKQLACKQWHLGVELIENPTVSKDPSGTDPLPDHLVALLQQPIINVMTDSAIQHAHDLAWGGSSFGAVVGKESTIHAEDTAMLGSLDTLAVRSSESILQQALIAFIEDNESDESRQYQVELALRVAPPGSISFFRALAATAITCETDRHEHIAMLSGALQPCNRFTFQSAIPAEPSPPSAEIETISMALDCASVMEIVAQSKDRPNAFCETLPVLNRALSTVETLDLLAYSAVYGLIRKLLDYKHCDGQPSNFKQSFLTAIACLTQPNVHIGGRRLQLQELCKKVIGESKLHSLNGRRVSNASIDSGYGSMLEYHQLP